MQDSMGFCIRVSWTPETPLRCPPPPPPSWWAYKGWKVVSCHMGTQEAPILRSLLFYLSKALPGKDDELPSSLKAHIYPVPLFSSLSEYHPLYTMYIQESRVFHLFTPCQS